MPLDLNKTLVVAISATALFDLSEADTMFQQAYEKDPDHAIDIYRAYMLEHEDTPLEKGTGFAIVEALLGLNRFQKKGELPLVEVVVMSRNSPETGLRVLNSIRHFKLPISRSAFTAGESPVSYLRAFSVDLFLTTSGKDAQQVIDSEECATAILSTLPKNAPALPTDQVRIAFDGDAVLFDEESELVYKEKGLQAFHENEDNQQNTPLEFGPYAMFLHKLSQLQERLPMKVEYSPVRIAIVTARNSPAEMRVIKTLRHWGVYVDEAFFLGGVEKASVLEAFNPHIFFDDQDVHLQTASEVVPSGKVPYKSGSLLNS
jgi:5'-nucleotidase